MPNDSPPVFGEQNTSTECSTRTLSSSLTCPSSATRSRRSAGTRCRTSSASRPAGHQEAQPGSLRAEDLERLEQHGQALARLVQPAQEADGATRAGPAGQRLGLAVAAGGHAVGDDDRVAADVLDQRGAGRLGDRDPAVDLLQRGPQHRIGDHEHPRARDRGVHGGHDRTRGHPAGQQGQAGDAGFVDVQHVEPALVEPAPDPAHRQEAERQPGHRPVIGHGHRTAGSHHVGRQRGVIVGRGDDRDLVPLLDQGLGQVPDVLLDAAGHVPGVRADHPDLHGIAPGRKVGGEDALEHVPVGRVFGDAGLEDPGQVLAHGRDLLRPGTRLGHRDLLVDVRAPVLPLEPGRDRHQRGAGVHGQGGGRGDPRLLPEHLDLDAGVLQVTVADQADQAAGAQPLGEGPERAAAAGQRQDLHPQALAEPDERLVHRFRPQPLGDGGERAGLRAPRPRPRPARSCPCGAAR